MAGPCIRQVTFNLQEKTTGKLFSLQAKTKESLRNLSMVLRQIGKGKEHLNGLINYLYCMMILKNKKKKNKRKVTLLLLLQSQVKKSQTSRRVLREQKKLYSVMSKMEHPGVNMSSSYIVSLAVDAI